MRKLLQQFKLYFLLVIFGICIVGCVKKTFSTSKTIATQTSSAQSTFAVTPILKNNTALGLTKPVATLPFSPTPTSTITNTQIFDTPSREELTESLLRTNGGCKLPCFWGIIPGKTTWDETVKILSTLDVNIARESPINIEYHVINPSPDQKKPDENINMVLQFQFNSQNTVNSIYVNSQMINGQSDFSRLWQLYSPQQIIRSYGKPSRVLLNAVPFLIGDKGVSGYTLWLLYDQQGVKIRYKGIVKFTPIYHFCPRMEEANDITDINIFIQSMKSKTSLEQTDDMYEELNTPPYKILTFEEATGKSLDDFYQIFSQTKDPACFDTTRDVWE